MKRGRFTVCSVASLLLCIGAAVLWGRSYGGSDYLSRATTEPAEPMTTRRTKVQWTLGQVLIARELHTFYPPPSYALGKSPPPHKATWGYGRLGVGHLGWERMGPGNAGSIWNRLGFATYETGTGASFFDMTEQGVAIPAWLPVVVFAVAPAWWAVAAWRRRARRVAGCCVACGYDLRATPSRCPECGVEARGRSDAKDAA